MSLETPIRIREFQRKLYTKAKQEPEYRYYMLYDKIHREDILAHAYALAKANGGAPGVDGQSFREIETQGRKDWLAALRQELIQESYQPQAVRRVMIPKANGGERPLGIPTIRDRVAQTAAKLVLEPIFEADLEPNAYGYRPRRGAQGAVKKVHQLLCDGYTDVVDADLSKYFDTIPHDELMKCVARLLLRSFEARSELYEGEIRRMQQTRRSVFWNCPKRGRSSSLSCAAGSAINARFALARSATSSATPRTC